MLTLVTMSMSTVEPSMIICDMTLIKWWFYLKNVRPGLASYIAMITQKGTEDGEGNYCGSTLDLEDVQQFQSSTL